MGVAGLEPLLLCSMSKASVTRFVIFLSVALRYFRKNKTSPFAVKNTIKGIFHPQASAEVAGSHYQQPT